MRVSRLVTHLLKRTKYPSTKCKWNRYLSATSQYLAIQSATTDHKDRLLKVEWENRKISKYPYIFLRDNCPCPLCFNPSTRSRLLDTVKEIDFKVTPVDVTTDGSSVKCTWPGGHESVYEEDWLKERTFPDSETDIRQTTYDDLIPVPWGSELLSDIPSVEYEAMQSSDEGLLDLISYLGTHGFCLIKRAPCSAGVLQNMAGKVSTGFFRTTNYG